MKKRIQDLFELQDINYRDFHSRLMPEIENTRIIGVRTPALRAYAKKIAKAPEAKNLVMDFLQDLPHYYYEENNLHGALLNLLYKNVEDLLEQVEKFLPFVDNWATCDTLSPRAFKRNLPLVYQYVKKWLQSKETYTVRFGIVTLLGFFLDEAFKPEMLDLVVAVKSEEYYIKMAVAWYFSIALVKQYHASVPYFTFPRLDKWTHNKALQKAIESHRIDNETKAYLKSLKLK